MRDPYEALLLLLLGAVLGTCLLTALDTLGVEGAAHDVVADTGKVLHTTTAHEHDGVLLEVVALTGDVGRDLDTGGQAHTGDLTEGGVRLLGGRGVHTGAHATALRTGLERRRLGRGALRRAALADQLLNGRHY